MKQLLILILILCLIQNLPAQGTAGSGSVFEPRYIVDMPTAGIIGSHSYAIDTDFYQSGGLLVGFSIGLLNTINLGVSYGAVNVIGTEKLVGNKLPGMQLKIRPLDETKILPAIAFGFDSQGKENYIDSLDRYKIKSPGLYLVTSKNFLVAGFLSIHGGMNYSLERSDDKDLNVYLGIEKSIGKYLSVNGEYNLGVNDSDLKSLGKGRGFLNFSLKGSFGKGFTIGINLKDVIQNQENIFFGNRTISVEYTGKF